MSVWLQNSSVENREVVLSPGRISMGRVAVDPQNELALPSIRVSSVRLGDSIFRRGDNVQGLYQLKTGVVKITSKCAMIRGRTVSEDYISSLIAPGDFFGYQDFLLNRQHQQEARAIKMAEVHMYPKELVQRLLASGGSFANQFMSQMAKHMLAEEERVKYQYLASVGERIAYTLIDLAHRFGEKIPIGTMLQLKLTRGELAQLAGTINESLSRHLSEMKDDNILEIRGKEILIKDMSLLIQRSGQD